MLRELDTEDTIKSVKYIDFVYRDGHGLGSMPIHLAHHCFSFDLRASRDSAHQNTPLTKKSCKYVHGKGVKEKMPIGSSSSPPLNLTHVTHKLNNTTPLNFADMWGSLTWHATSCCQHCSSC